MMLGQGNEFGMPVTGTINLGIRKFKRAQRSTLLGRKPSSKHLAVTGKEIRAFKDERWDSLR